MDKLELFLSTHNIDSSWLPVFRPIEQSLESVLTKVQNERLEFGEEAILPSTAQLFAAFKTPFDKVRVLILGQDPYPTPGHPNGLAFSVDAKVTVLPGSLKNIFKELSADLNCPTPQTGDLSRWAKQGVLLLNTSLSVRAKNPGAHAKIGWLPIIQHIIASLIARENQNLIAILWGKHAASFLPDFGFTQKQKPTAVYASRKEYISADARIAVITSAHPSPLSAHRGFFGSKPFSRTNEILQANNQKAIVWQDTLETLF